nr:tyrosine-type recombinase/integrase [uncultured Sphingomonas sp.]
MITPKVKHHAAIIEPDKVGATLRAIDGYEGQPSVALALRIAPHVFVRPGELRAAEWAEFDLSAKAWTIPGEKMKMGRPHRVPLSKQVLALLAERREMSGRSKLLFPGVRSDARPISDDTINATLGRRGTTRRVDTLCAILPAEHGEAGGAAIAGAWLAVWLRDGLVAVLR